MTELEINLRFTPGLLRWAAVGFFLCAGAGELSTESFTLTTSYPAPSGVYTKLITTQDAYLARDGGNVGIGTTSPAARLDVNGAARIGGDVAAAGNLSASGGVSASGNVSAAGVLWGGDVKVGGPPPGGASCITTLNCVNGVSCTPPNASSPNTWTISH